MRPGAVDHDLVDLGVSQQRLQRAEAERASGDPGNKIRARRRVEQARLAVDQQADALERRRAIERAAAGLRQQALAETVGEVVQGAVHTPSGCGTAELAPLPAP